MLGTGTPGPSPERSGPATAIVVNGTAYLVDIGPGVIRRASAAAARHQLAALQPTALRVVFVTHLHSDHTVGYPDLIFTPWVVGRRVPLEVFGPPGLRAMTDHVLAAWADDIRIRNEGLERDFPEHTQNSYQVVVHEITQPGVVYRDSNVTVTAFGVKHGEWKYAYGYRFDTPDRRIVITGDTSPTGATVDACDGCDLLIHEVYTEKGYATAPPVWQNYRRRYHTSTRQLAELAARARPKLLVLYHQMYQGNASTEADLIEEMKRFYRGQFSSAKDLDIY
jgi:ribonuclease Z